MLANIHLSHGLLPQRSHCKHVHHLGDYSQENIAAKQALGKCEAEDCYSVIGNLWACLHEKCLFVGCAGNEFDHILIHFQNNEDHCIILDLNSLRVFCYSCSSEIFLENNDPPLPGVVSAYNAKFIRVKDIYRAEPDSDSEDDETQNNRPRGLTGLKNLGNTCYINAALQALSNCPPLMQFFLDCGSSVRVSSRECISRSYLKLMNDIWHKQRPSFLIPDTLVRNFKESSSAHWLFGNYNQQDSQEFLRYFMDALHEELKEPLMPMRSQNVSGLTSLEYDCISDEEVEDDPVSNLVSDVEYETCESEQNSESNRIQSSCSDDENIIHYDDDSDQSGLFADNGPESKSHRNRRHKRKTDNQQHSSEKTKKASSVKNIPLAELEDCHQETVSNPTTVSTSTTTVTTRKVSCDFDVKRRLSNTGSDTEVVQQQQTNNPRMSNDRCASNVVSNAKKKNIEMRSIISDVFDGKIVSSVQCLTCDTVSSTKETFQDLSLPIPTYDQLIALHGQMSNSASVVPTSVDHSTDQNGGEGWLSWGWSWLMSWFWGPSITLHDCLAAFFSADELKGDNMYSCGKCKKLRNGIKYSRVLKLPEVLCVHLKRFRSDLTTKSAKISKSISFPLEDLDLGPYMHKDSSDQVTSYDLTAVICHYGSDSGCGHYTTYATNKINGAWYEFDDQFVTEVFPESVRCCESYVLFYGKTSDEMNRRRMRVVDLMKRSYREPGLLQFYISKQWVNRFNTFAEPGPISNTDFLCSHGGVHPVKASYVGDLCMIMSQSVWEYLYVTFGGGPACNHLFVCPICQSEKDYLDKRKKNELETFVKLHKEFKAIDQPSVMCAISMLWFREWQNFVRSKDLINEPPGPIDNNKIATPKGNHFTLKLGSDFGQMSEAMWQYLHEIYGGGPQLITHLGTCQTLAASNPGQTKSSPSTTSNQQASNSNNVSSPQRRESSVAESVQHSADDDTAMDDNAA